MTFPWNIHHLLEYTARTVTVHKNTHIPLSIENCSCQRTPVQTIPKASRRKIEVFCRNAEATDSAASPVKQPAAVKKPLPLLDWVLHE